MVANTRDGYLGNEPDGYHATMVSWMHARALLFATEAKAVSSGPQWTTLGLMRKQLTNIAHATNVHGVVSSGYGAESALDTNSSFALFLHDYALTTGDRTFVRTVIVAVRRALDSAPLRAGLTGGLLTGSLDAPEDQSDAVIDYWDWLRRPGSVSYPNVLLIHALDCHAELERWIGNPGRASEYANAASDLRDRALGAFWDDNRGCLAESRLGNAQFHHLYTAVQYLAITSGFLDRTRAATVMDSLSARLAALPETWQSALAMPTNLCDASDLMPRFPPPANGVVEFGHTMNGGSLLSWAYFEIGALVTLDRVDEAWTRARAVFNRFESTALLEGCNYWDYRGRPGRARLEPFLSDVGLVASVLPRWFMGVSPQLIASTSTPRSLRQVHAGCGSNTWEPPSKSTSNHGCRGNLPYRSPESSFRCAC